MLDKTFSMQGKHVVITGASSGFGAHFAELIASAGGKVVLGARRVDKLDALVNRLNTAGGEALALALDVRDPASAQAFLDNAAAAFGPIDVLINNAGVESGAKTYAMIDEDDWDYVMDTNLKAAWRLSKYYTEHVVANQQPEGNIVNIASITAFRTIKGQFPYAVSKAALIKVTEVMALEAAKYGIREMPRRRAIFLLTLAASYLRVMVPMLFAKVFPCVAMASSRILMVPYCCWHLMPPVI